MRRSRIRKKLLKRIYPVTPAIIVMPRVRVDEFRENNGETTVFLIFSASKDWHHAGKDRALLCTDCRMYFKRYGELRSVDRPTTPPPYLFRPVKDGEMGDYVPGVRTRGRSSASKEAFAASVSFSLVGGRRRPMTPTAEMETSRKSLSAVSTTSTSSSSAAESEPIAALLQNGVVKVREQEFRSKKMFCESCGFAK